MTDKINNSLLKSGCIYNNNKFIFEFKRKDIETEVDLILYNRMKTFELSDDKSIGKNTYFIVQKLNLRMKKNNSFINNFRKKFYYLILNNL